MERIAEMEAMQEMMTDQEENIKKKEVERDGVRDREKQSRLSDQIKRLKKALIEDMVKYSSTIKKWKKEDQKQEKEDQKHEKGYEADNEEGFGGGRKKRRKRTRRKKRTKRRRSSRHRRSKKRRTRRRRKTKRRRGGVLGTDPVRLQRGGAGRTKYQQPTSVMKGGGGQVTVQAQAVTPMLN
ncbi:MAG TPA: hypothetical protein EYO31_09505 [Phycisphaerales bacterium]|nr:hypothetical protein [Phycisphaerales bacterium]